MKATLRTLFGLVVVLAIAVAARAEDEKKADKEQTWKGTLGCAKCVFKVKGITKCTNAIKVTENKKDKIVLFDDQGAKEKYHGTICTASAKGSVTGTLVGKGKDQKIKPSKDGVKFDE